MEKPIEIAVVSGKGGTGKTVFASSLARLADSRVIADCDVDAPNMHLLLNPFVRSQEPFFGGKTAVMDSGLCTRCGECFKACRFGAVREKDAPEGWQYSIDTVLCEGCAACTKACAEGALRMVELPPGAWYLSDSDCGPLVHANLAVGQRNPEELVRIVRREARKTAACEGLKNVIIDGPAGIGAPLITAVVGIALAVVITEPTLTGIYGLRRVVELMQQLGRRTVGVLNKSDLNLDVAVEVEEYLAYREIPFLGRIPFSNQVNKAIADGEFFVDVTGDTAAEEMRRIALQILGLH
jgi:MinD superfamily P-loop ATPase